MDSKNSMEHFCTLFDIGFLPQGMSLHASLQRHAMPFTLWVLCMDEAVEKALGKMNLPNVRCIPLCTIETPELLAVKEGRTRVEYCWTLTPFLPMAVMELDPSVQRATYVDADCWFVNDPRLILEEMDNAGKDVLITPHDYMPGQDESIPSGIFCVQFMPFRRTVAGMGVLAWWQARCLEWCFNRIEDGRLGDQKYLDLWPGLFPHVVHVLKNTKLTMAPWNVERYESVPDLRPNSCMYHFQNLRIFDKGLVCLSLNFNYYLPQNVLKFFYVAYFKDLAQSMHIASSQGISVLFPLPGEYRSLYVCFKDTLRGLIKNRWRLWRRIK
jgi:hypothetical protein